MSTQLISNYLGHLISEGYSPNTIRAYKYGLALLEEFDLNAITTRDLMIIMGKDWDKTTAASRQAAFKSFFKWLVEEGKLNHNPASALGPIRVAPLKRDTINCADMAIIFTEFQKTPLVVRVFFELLRDTEMQINEILDLKVEDIIISDSSITINRRIHPSLTIDNPLLKILCEEQERGDLFISSWGRKASYYWAYRWWKKIMEKTSLKYTINQLKNTTETETA